MADKKKELVVVDLFCGCGGATEAFARAVPYFTDIQREEEIEKALKHYLAVNHWTDAIATHQKNHPWAEHKCADIRDVKPREAVPGGRVHLLMAGPECTFFSSARGAAPINDQSRITAFTVLDWLDKLYVDCFIIENVAEFRDWAPLGANGRPLKSKRGETFKGYIDGIKRMGYRLEHRVINCADYGDPTSRERLFIIGRRDKQPLIWPEPTHGDPKKLEAGQLSIFCRQPLKPWRTAAEIINPEHRSMAKSVFNRARPLSPNTMRRIWRGLEKFGLRKLLGGQPMTGEPFLVKLRGTGTANDVNEPLDTVTAGGNHYALCEPMLISTGGPKQAPQSSGAPFPTILTREQWGLAETFLVGVGGPVGAGRPKPTDQPLNTILAENRIGLAEPFIIGAGGPARAGEPRASDRPLGTVLTRPTSALVEPWIMAIRGGNDGYLRAAETGEPLPAMTTVNPQALVEAERLGFLAPVSHGKNDARAHALEAPVPTVTGVHNLGLVELDKFVVTMDQTGSNGVCAAAEDAPIATVTTKARHLLAEPYLIQYHGETAPGRERVTHLHKPLPVQDTSNRYGLAEPFLIKYYGVGDAAALDLPLDTVTTKDRFALCIPILDGYVLVDILLRMLQPDELAAAHSYRKSFQFVNANGRPASKKNAVKMIGNSWPNETGKALIVALMDPRRAAYVAHGLSA